MRLPRLRSRGSSTAVEQIDDQVRRSPWWRRPAAGCTARRRDRDWPPTTTSSRPTPGHAEHALDHHCAGDQAADHEADDGHDRDRRIGQRVRRTTARHGRPLARRGADIGLAEHLEHGAAGEAREDAGPANSERDDRQDGVRHAVLPPDGSQPSWTAKTSTSTRPSTKLGTVKPATAPIITMRSTRCRDAGRQRCRRGGRCAS